MTISLDVLLQDSAYKLDQFKPALINALHIPGSRLVSAALLDDELRHRRGALRANMT